MCQRALIGLVAAAVLWQCAIADCLVLDDGTRLAGRVNRLDADAVELISCGSRRLYLRASVHSVEFNPAAAECSQETPEAAGVAVGTRLSVKLSRPIDPMRDPVGQVIGGSLEQPVALGDRLLIRNGAPVLLQLEPAADAKRAPSILHVTAVRLDSGWVGLDAIADDSPASLSQVFTVRDAPIRLNPSPPRHIEPSARPPGSLLGRPRRYLASHAP